MEKITKRTLARHWWAILARGLIAVTFAIIAFSWSDLTLALLVAILGISIMFDGIFSIMGSMKAVHDHKNWWVQLIQGILTILLGILVISWTGVTAVVILFFVAIWAVVTGIFELWISCVAPWDSATKYLAGIVGILSLVLGIIMMLFPIQTLTVIIWLIGIYAMILGLTLIVFSFQLRRLK